MNLDDYVLTAYSSGEVVYSPEDHAGLSDGEIEDKCQLSQAGIYWFAKCLKRGRPNLKWEA